VLGQARRAANVTTGIINDNGIHSMFCRWFRSLKEIDRLDDDY
jgi:hypothetical protein